MMNEPLMIDPNTPKLADLTDEAVAAAAKWWADHLRARTKHDNGDPLTNAFAAVVMKEIKVTAEEVDAFEAALRAEMFSDVDPVRRDEKLDMRRGRVNLRRDRLSVDYGPCAILSSAIEATKLDAKVQSALSSLLPIKSNQRISAVGVSGGAGYYAPIAPIWTSWTERPAMPAWATSTKGPRCPELRVVDRWVPQWQRGEPPGHWKNGGDPDAQLALVTLSKPLVEPETVALVLRGYVSVGGFHDQVEDQILGAFRDDMGGYLALVRQL